MGSHYYHHLWYPSIIISDIPPSSSLISLHHYLLYPSIIISDISPYSSLISLIHHLWYPSIIISYITQSSSLISLNHHLWYHSIIITNIIFIIIYNITAPLPSLFLTSPPSSFIIIYSNVIIRVGRYSTFCDSRKRALFCRSGIYSYESNYKK